MEFISIAGLAISTIGLMNDLASTYRDLTNWEEKDIEVDNDWMALAIQNKIIEPPEGSYVWANLRHVPTLELKGTHQVVIAVNKDRRLKYRIVRGSTDPIVLMKKTS